ncbi:hypothetical protein NDU88_002608 [Pleurodeles waltl]|uniref:Uncharacterized protein n=1 Tax=Pleurodeles waltl TaxID=8319 RepID=A0AAV7TL58_PLEWA|nr:hypothetical protein NDU88_002608 [Pleurodeles waltl]
MCGRNESKRTAQYVVRPLLTLLTGRHARTRRCAHAHANLQEKSEWLANTRGEHSPILGLLLDPNSCESGELESSDPVSSQEVESTL